MKKTALFSKRGFTLIELVVVISIIAILSTIALFGFSKAQASARDASRQQTVNAMRSALERYYADNQKYPTGKFGDAVATLTTGGYLGSTALTDAAKSCTTQPSPVAGLDWTPCGSGKVPTYVYDSSITAYGTCTNVSGTLTLTGCKAECSVANACFSIFLFNEASTTVTRFTSPL